MKRNLESKLTLKLNTSAVNGAKNYIQQHKGTSLSRLVENYFNTLTITDVSKKVPTPIVSSLEGAASKHKSLDMNKEYTDYLIEKYS